MNIKVRWKNPWFYVFIISAVFTAIGVDPSMFTSWDVVKTEALNLLSNPFLLGTSILTILGIFVDPTTAGVSDSEQAKLYTTPKKSK